jgi:hypothetical protein
VWGVRRAGSILAVRVLATVVPFAFSRGPLARFDVFRVAAPPS